MQNGIFLDFFFQTNICRVIYAIRFDMTKLMIVLNNRDLKLVIYFWKYIFQSFNINLIHSIVCHPRMNDKSERSHQTDTCFILFVFVFVFVFFVYTRVDTNYEKYLEDVK